MSTTQIVDEQLSTDAADVSAAPVIEGAGLGPQLAPWAAMGGLVLAAGAARIALYATSDADAELATSIAGAAYVIAIVTAYVTRRRPMSRRLRQRFVAALYLGATWISAVAFQGFSVNAMALLTILGAGLSLLYWREHRIGPGVPPQLLDLDGDGDLYVTRWAQNIGANGRALAGSRLTDPEIIKSGYRYTLQLVPGVHTVAMARNPEMLRGGLRLLPGQDVIVETHPELPSPTALLTIITRSPVRKPHVWPGPEAGFDPVNGSVNLGPFVDGEGPPAQWSVYKLDGMFGGYLQGGTGSGKSRMIEQIAMSCAASKSHPTVVWFGDGQGGSSSPLLAEHADWFAPDFSSIYNMLLAAVQVGKINAVENRIAGRVGFHPTAERPGLLVIVDECHKPLSAKENPLLAGPTQLLMATIVRELRKAGVALILASQSATLDAFGNAGNGNLADTLRSNILVGNGVILRSKTSNAKVVFQVDVDPRQFPKLPGYAYLVDPDEDARSAPFRGSWVTDELAAFWPKRIIWRSLPHRQANMAGAHYARRREVAAEQAFADELLLQMADAGTLDEMQDLERQLDAAAVATAGNPPDVVEFGDVHPPIRRVAKFWVPEPRNGAGLLPGQQKVLDAIRAGNTRPKQIAAATGYSDSQVYNLIDDLKDAGHISKAGYGQYQAA